MLGVCHYSDQQAEGMPVDDARRMADLGLKYVHAGHLWRFQPGLA